MYSEISSKALQPIRFYAVQRWYDTLCRTTNGSISLQQHRSDFFCNGSAHACGADPLSLLIRAGIEMNPGPALNILQLNINGLAGKAQELEMFLHKNNIKIAALQETKLSSRSRLKFPHFTVVRLDRTNHGGGLALLIHESIQFSTVDLPQRPVEDIDTEVQAIHIPSPEGGFTIVNVYVPPSSSCPANFHPLLSDILDIKDGLILGDFNAHDELWFSSLSDDRGATLADEIEMSEYGVLNANTSTRVPSNGRATSPDISLASASLLTSAEWCTHTALSSDHIPIIITLDQSQDAVLAPKKKFINIAKANWKGFTTSTEALF